MTTKNGNINTILSQAFNKVSLEFNGELSSTGSKREYNENKIEAAANSTAQATEIKS